MKKLIWVVLALALLLGAWWLFMRGKTAGEGDLWSYVPAEASYFYGMKEPLPKDVVQSWQAQAKAYQAMYVPMFDSISQSMKDDPNDELAMRWLNAIKSEFALATTQDVEKQFGFADDARFVLYDIDLVPVIRFEISKPEAFADFIRRMEEQVGQKLKTRELSSHTIQYGKLPDSEDGRSLNVGFAVMGQHLVVSAFSDAMDDKEMARLFGVTPPKQAIGGKRMDALLGDYDFHPSMFGELDFTRGLDALTRAPHPLYVSLLGSDAKPDISKVCADEFRGIFTRMPRMVSGYTKLTGKHMDIDFVLELDKPLVDQLKQLQTPLVGAERLDDGEMFGMSMGMDMSQIGLLVMDWKNQIKAAPYACDMLDFMNELANEKQTSMQLGMLAGTASVAKSMTVVLDDIELSDDGEDLESVSGVLLIGSDHPQGLVAMGKSYVPGLKDLTIKTDGSVYPLPDAFDFTQELGMPVFYSASEKVLAVGVGDDMEDDLGDWTKAPGAQTNPPWFGMGITGEAYANLFAQSLKSMPEDAEERAQIEAMMALYEDMMDYFWIEFGVNDHGLIMRQKIRMK